MPRDCAPTLLLALRGILRLVRWVLVLGLGALIVVFVADFLLNLMFVKTAVFYKLYILRLITDIGETVVQDLGSVIRFKTKVRGIELMPLLIGALLFAVARFLNSQLQQLTALVDAEYQVRQVRQLRAQRTRGESVKGLTFSSTSTDKVLRGFWGRFLRRKGEERDRLLREFVEAKKRLEKVKQRLAFLSLDIVGSSRMKVGQEPLLSERAFREYRHFLEQILRKYRYRTASWTPDGVMVRFPQVELASGAAKEVLERLPSFNRKKNPLSFPIQVRCGLNAGEVHYDQKTPLELLVDPVLDITGHLQKAARPNALLVTEEIYEQLRDKRAFAMREGEVDGYRVFEWSAGSGNSAADSPRSGVVA